MKTCWLCREDVTQDLARLPDSHVGMPCPSCKISLNRNGGQYYDEQPGMVNVNIALARAVDRLTKQLDKTEQERWEMERWKKLGFK
jgi:hypothetical protein